MENDGGQWRGGVGAPTSSSDPSHWHARHSASLPQLFFPYFCTLGLKAGGQGALEDKTRQDMEDASSPPHGGVVGRKAYLSLLYLSLSLYFSSHFTTLMWHAALLCAFPIFICITSMEGGGRWHLPFLSSCGSSCMLRLTFSSSLCLLLHAHVCL